MQNQSMLIELDELLKYRNRHVLERYCRDFQATPEKAEEQFAEMLKYFWLAKKNRLEIEKNPNMDAHVYMHPEMIDIDHMWHTFLLFTYDYADFGNKYFGEYLHHQPRTDDDIDLPREEAEKQFALFLDYIYEHLGEITVRKWFAQHV